MPENKMENKIRILVLTADPGDLGRLWVGEEVRKIVHKVWETRHRGEVEVIPELAVRRDELITLLHRHRPHVLHFSGHGNQAGQIFLVSNDNQASPLSPEALKAILAEFNDTVRLVFLNACYSALEAEAIAEVVDCAVGSEGAISDRAAIAFAASFYESLASGSTIGRAVNLGKAQLMIEEIQGEAQIRLISKPGVDPHQIRIVEPETLDGAPESKPAPQIETDVTGRLYISYAPTQTSDTHLIASALRDRGVPLCDEALSEDIRLTKGAMTNVLNSPGTSGGLLSLTPEAVQAQPVQSEIAVMLDRSKLGGNFFVAAAQFSDFDLAEVGVQLRSGGTPIRKVHKKRPGLAEAADIARFVLERRIDAIHRALPPGQPLRLELYTKMEPPLKQDTVLLIDWTRRFNGRFATPEQWDQYLLPALQDIAEVVGKKAPGRAIQADGRPSLPAAIALGCRFVQTRDIKIGWWQHTLGRPDELWRIEAPREPCGFTVESHSHRPDGDDLAVLVAVTRPVEPAFEASQSGLPPFRAIVRVWKTPLGIDAIANAGQAADLARMIHDNVRDAATYQRARRIHLFMSVPAGLAMMIGQLLNTLGPIQTYDLEPTDAVGEYRPAALLKPSEPGT